MDDIIKQLNDLPYERLEQLEYKIKNIKEIKNYFNTIKNEYWKQYLPENTADIIENKVKVVSITNNDETIELSDETYNNCYDDGFWTVNIQLEIIGINGLVGLKYIHHSYKNTIEIISIFLWIITYTVAIVNTALVNANIVKIIRMMMKKLYPIIFLFLRNCITH